LALPFKGLTGRDQRQWTILSETFRCIDRKILPSMARRSGAPLRLLDLGAGNGWLSYRLALRGHLPVAIDLLVDAVEGLGAASHYLHELPSLFPRFQADFDRLPFTDHQFDGAIFGASFRFSEDQSSTLGEAIRCIRPGGTVIVVDAPFGDFRRGSDQSLPSSPNSRDQKQTGRSEASPGADQLAHSMAKLEAQFNFSWQRHRPQYGLLSALHPFISKWTNTPPPYQVYTAQVNL
jgi:SAM-dependent methyltransferase